MVLNTKPFDAAEVLIADETRYACLSRPLIASPPPAPKRPFDSWRPGPEETTNWKVL